METSIKATHGAQSQPRQKKAEMTASIESASFMALTKRTIGPKEDPYLQRWIILQTPLFSIYVHKLVRSDYDRALHDHPWGFISFILTGYAEEVCVEDQAGLHWDMEFHRTGDILFRKATHRHRVIITDKAVPGWTIVLTGPRSRKWGFWPEVSKGRYSWCHWKSYDMDKGICESGPIAGRKGLD